MTMESNQVRIFHDPHRAVSRNTLGLIRNSGIEPTIVDYLHERGRLSRTRPQLQRGFYANESGEILISADGKQVLSRMR
jgi:hypothetical protein